MSSSHTLASCWGLGGKCGSSATHGCFRPAFGHKKGIELRPDDVVATATDMEHGNLRTEGKPTHSVTAYVGSPDRQMHQAWTVTPSLDGGRRRRSGTSG